MNRNICNISQQSSCYIGCSSKVNGNGIPVDVFSECDADDSSCNNLLYNANNMDNMQNNLASLNINKIHNLVDDNDQPGIQDTQRDKNSEDTRRNYESSSEDNEEDDGYIYAYKGENGVVDLPDSFYNVNFPLLNIRRENNQSPDADYLEMDFDPGSVNETNSDDEHNIPDCESVSSYLNNDPNELSLDHQIDPVVTVENVYGNQNVSTSVKIGNSNENESFLRSEKCSRCHRLNFISLYELGMCNCNNDIEISGIHDLSSIAGCSSDYRKSLTCSVDNIGTSNIEKCVTPSNDVGNTEQSNDQIDNYVIDNIEQHVDQINNDNSDSNNSDSNYEEDEDVDDVDDNIGISEEDDESSLNFSNSDDYTDEDENTNDTGLLQDTWEMNVFLVQDKRKDSVKQYSKSLVSYNIESISFWSDKNGPQFPKDRKNILRIDSSNTVITIYSALETLKCRYSFEEMLKLSNVTRLVRSSESFYGYLLERYSFGTTPDHLANVIRITTANQVYTKFFHTYPDRDFLLSEWLHDWISKGVIPVITRNIQREGTLMQDEILANPWSHHVVYKVDERGIYLSHPYEFICESTLRRQLCQPSVIYATREPVLHRWHPALNLYKLATDFPSSWQELNVLGQIVNMVREQHLESNVPTQYIKLPSTNRCGITLVVDKQSQYYKDVLESAQLPNLELRNT